MTRSAGTLIALLPLLLVLALAASPAAAQPPPDPQPQPDPNQPVREVCVPAGLGLAVIAESGTVAEVLPPERNSSSPTLVPGIKIVVQAPAAVGACAAFEGFWGEATGGREQARLTLYSLGNATDPALATPIARDGVSETRRGPSRHEAELRAIATFDKPGVYQLAAQLVVEAGEPDAAGIVGNSVSDQHRFVFTVDVRDGGQPPAPAPNAHGTLTGLVTDVAGQPIEGAIVSAAPGSNVRPGPADRWSVAPSAVRSVAMTGAAGSRISAVPLPSTMQQAGVSARTGPDGRYAMRLPAGRFLVRAEARGFGAQWFDDQPTAANARPVPVRDGEETSGIDFALLPVTPGNRPDPSDLATIKGTVARPDGSPVSAVNVVAVLAADALPSSPNVPPGQNLEGVSVKTDRQGRFKLRVTPDTYIVVAMEGLTASGRWIAAQYYDHQERAQDAEQLELHAADVVEGVDFTLDRP